MSTDPEFFNELFDIIQERRNSGSPDESYVAKLAEKGLPKIAQKVGEEASEVIIAAMQKDKKELIYESADLIFHLMMLWAEAGLTPADIIEELYGRQCKVKHKHGS